MSFFSSKIDNLKSKKRELFEFILYNIDPQRDNLVIEKNIVDEPQYKPVNNNVEFPVNNKIKNFTKEKINKYLTMIDSTTQEKLSLQTTIPCMGCHRKYNTCPLGVPIKYVPNILNTELTTVDGIKVNIKKNISCEQTKKYVDSHPLENKTITFNDYFITDSIVCSFNCMLNVFNENPEYYKNTPSLLYLMYYKIFGDYPNKTIIPAPNWRLRKEYDGPLTDEEFGNCLQTVKFIDSNQLQVKCIGKLYEAFTF
jgi:hypothetical protein